MRLNLFGADANVKCVCVYVCHTDGLKTLTGTYSIHAGDFEQVSAVDDIFQMCWYLAHVSDV